MDVLNSLAPSEEVRITRRPNSPSQPFYNTSIAGKTLQIGIGWLPEQDGGLNRVYYDLMHHLPGAGVDVLGMVQGSAKVHEQTRGSVRPFASPTASLPARWIGERRLMKRMLQEEDISLVVSHFALYAFPVLDLMRDTPHVVHFQGPWALESKVEGDGPMSVRLKYELERIVYGRASQFIVLSTAFRDILHRSYGVPESRISIVPCGVDADHFATDFSQARARERLQWPTDRPVILAVRRLVQRMGLENLIAAMQEVRRRVPDALLLIAGRGPLTSKIEALITEAGLQDHVRLLGFVPEEDLPLAYRAADLTVVPSIALEGMGCITLESMAAGTPVVVTPVGGLPEAVHGLSEDLILPDASKAAVAAGLIDALTGALPLPSSDACRQYIRTHFDWPVIAERVRDVYARAVAS